MGTNHHSRAFAFVLRYFEEALLIILFAAKSENMAFPRALLCSSQLLAIILGL